MEAMGSWADEQRRFLQTSLKDPLISPPFSPESALKHFSLLPLHAIHMLLGVIQQPLAPHKLVAQTAQQIVQLPRCLAQKASNSVQPLSEGLRANIQTQSAQWRKQELGRSIEFWIRAVGIYGSYKVCQGRVSIAKNKEEQTKIWDAQHEEAADRLYTLCTDLGGFFLKAGQFFAKPDLAPDAWVKKLSQLHDCVPADAFPVIRSAIEKELGGKFLSQVFEWVEEKPLGSASIAQVHKGKLKGSGRGQCVAVKVQRAGVEPLMLMDLRNLKHFAAFLQKFELPFDLLSILEELGDQIRLEFDFHLESSAMDRIGQSLRTGGSSRRAQLKKMQKGTETVMRNGRTRKESSSRPSFSDQSPIIVPRSIPGLVTRKLLVMEYVDGVQILRLPEEVRRKGIDPNGPLARRAKTKIFKDLVQAFGLMMLRDGEFQADPHPGNILVCTGPKVALLDYGQTKDMTQEHRVALARLILAAASGDPLQVGEAFKAAGIETQKTAAEDPFSFRKMALVMWDTKHIPGMSSSNPFDQESSLKNNSLNKFPKDLFFALKTMQFLRGLALGMDVNVSAAEMWRPLAIEVLKEA